MDYILSDGVITPEASRISLSWISELGCN
jgi:hypothetical protein